MKNPIRIAHVLHHMQIGGVENAARYHLLNTKNNYHVFCLDSADPSFLLRCDEHKVTFRRSGESRLLYMIRFFREVRNFNPDLIVSSLWRSHVVVLFLSRYLDSTWVSFFHSSKYFHSLDRASTYLAVTFSDAIFCDSRSTEAYIRAVSNNSLFYLISFHFHDNSNPSFPWLRRKKKAAYFGRLSKIKNLFYLVDLFSRINSFHPLSLDIYGAGEEEVGLRLYIEKLGLGDVVTLAGTVPPEDVPGLMCGYRYYFQTSMHEGMALSVMQAMSAQCCCFVNFVGEIDNYAMDLYTAVNITPDDIEGATERVMSIIQSDLTCSAIAEKAANVFVDTDDYSFSFDRACQMVLLANDISQG
ncbi:MAG: glycosyltransferase [Gammaproteobacteria bacterium]|nr:glycosyltransferase [Gammaproteobacteria bacterium]